MPLSKFSRETVFINTGPIDSRVHMMKSKAELKKMNESDTNITLPDVFEKYTNRIDMEHLCLADFVATKNERKMADGKYKYSEREKPRIIRYVRYSIEKDEANFFREQCLLFLPWKDEKKEIETQNCAELYHKNKDLIEENQRKYVTISEERLEEIFNEIESHEDSQGQDITEEDKELMEFLCEQGETLDIDIFEQGGKTEKSTKPKSKEKLENITNRFFSPMKIPEDDMLKNLEILNLRQRQFVMHILKCIRTEQNVPFHYFLSGAAGVGKSTVINSIYQLVTHHFDNLRGADPSTIKVLLTAPNGKAAHLINGTTLHTAFALPVNQYGGNELPELSSDIANSIRVQLIGLKLLIIDEISMVGTRLLYWIHQRLVQICGRNEPFGGICVIVVGDLNQLAPIRDSKVFVPFKNPNNISLGKLIGPISPLWEHFEYFELSEIMRQRDEAEFIEALNHLATGNMTEADIAIIKSRETKRDSVPSTAIRLFHTNADVDNYNEERIEKASGDSVKVEAFDRVDGKPSDKVKKRTLAILKNKNRSETYGLPHRINLKIGIRYMITTNIDIEDGLVNGACGILKYIEFEKNQPKTLFLDFNSDRVGTKARREYKQNLPDGVKRNWVPIC